MPPLKPSSSLGATFLLASWHQACWNEGLRWSTRMVQLLITESLFFPLKILFAFVFLFKYGLKPLISWWVYFTFILVCSKIITQIFFVSLPFILFAFRSFSWTFNNRCKLRIVVFQLVSRFWSSVYCSWKQMFTHTKRVIFQCLILNQTTVNCRISKII